MNEVHTQHVQYSSQVSPTFFDAQHITLVTWNGPDDSKNPQNWPLFAKFRASVAPISVILAISFASSSFGPCESYISTEYGISDEMAKLCVALFIAGYAVGPLVFAPMAEIVGNVPPLVIALIGCAIFQVPLGLAQNAVTIFVSSFFAGVIGSAALAVGSGILADIFGPVTRGAGVAVTACFVNFHCVFYELGKCHFSYCRGLHFNSIQLALGSMDQFDCDRRIFNDMCFFLEGNIS